MKNKLEFLTNNQGHRWEKWNAEEQTHYQWDRYNTSKSSRWYWDKYQAEAQQRYLWEQATIKQDQQHTWHQYETVDTLKETDYLWDKYNTNIIPRYPSWDKKDIDHDQIYVWDQYDAVVDTVASNTQNGEVQYNYEYGGTTYLKPAYKLKKATRVSSTAKDRINALHTMQKEYTFQSAAAHVFLHYSSDDQGILDGHKDEWNDELQVWQRLYDEYNSESQKVYDIGSTTYYWMEGTTKLAHAYSGIDVTVCGEIEDAVKQSQGYYGYSPFANVKPRIEYEYSRPLFTWKDPRNPNKDYFTRTYKEATTFNILPHYSVSRQRQSGNQWQPARTIDSDYPGQIVVGPTYVAHYMDGSTANWRLVGCVEDKSAELQAAIQKVLDAGYEKAYVIFSISTKNSYNNSIKSMLFDDTIRSDRAISYNTSGQMEAFEVYHSNYTLNICAQPMWAINRELAPTSESTCYATIDNLTFPLGTRDHYVSDPFNTDTSETFAQLVDNGSPDNYGLELWHDNDIADKILDTDTRLGVIPVSDLNTSEVTLTHPGPNGEQTYYLGKSVATANITLTSQPTITQAGTITDDSTIWESDESWVNIDYQYQQADGLGKIHYLLYDPGTIYKAGDKVGIVKDKSRDAYPDNAKVDDYWYIYLRQQSVQPYLIQCIYTTDFDLTNWVTCSSEPVFDTDTGLLTYTLGEGSYYINSLAERKDSYITKLNNAYLYWTSFENDGTQLFDYGDYLGDQRYNSQFFQQNTMINSDHERGSYIEQVMVPDNSEAYPVNAEHTDGYWYVYKTSVPVIVTTKGAYIQDVSWLNELHYPLDDHANGYWYTYVGVHTVYSAGQVEGTVHSTSPTEYPASGISNGAWYTYKGQETAYVCGDFIETLETQAADSYPEDGMSGYYWYKFNTYKIITLKEELEGQEDSTDNQLYPADGVVGTKWYVLTGNYRKLHPTYYVEDVWSDNSTAYPEDGDQGGYYYKYQGYKYIPQYIINDTMLKGGVKYQQEVNTSEDLIPGDVASAQIDFTIFSNPREAQKYLDLECDYYTRQQEQDKWELVGHFVISAASDKTATTTKLTGFDNVSKLDADVTDYMFNGGIVYPITLANLFNGVCGECGVTGEIASSVVNTDFAVQDNFTTKNITGRQVLALIAEATGGFVKADEEGKIVLRGYEADGRNFDKSKYSDLTLGIYNTQQIDKVNVAMSSDDIGVSYGNGEVVLRIIDNPLLYIENEHEIDTQLTNLYNHLHPIVYTPGSMTLLEPLALKTGDIVQVDGQTFYVMSISWDGSKVKVESKGQRFRTVENNQIDGSLDKLRGKSNELTRTIDETNSRITDVQSGLQSQITQTASTINTRITNVQSGLQSQITQTADSVTSTVEQYTDDAVSQAKSEIKQTTDSISSTVSSQGNTITQIRQDLNGISMTYNSTNGTASITIGDVTVTNLVDGDYVQRQVAGIDLTGYVTFHSLETAGQTTINGSNITTGTISADRINMTGSVSWGDLTQSCKNTIASYAGQDGSDANVPSYIHSTYIDATTIMSPTIQGGTISAGTTADGYVQMSNTGMNFHSGSKSILGIGYYSGYYQYPYIIFGAGVDSSGTDQGMIKKYADGIWIGDSDGKNSSTVGSGDGIFIKFTDHTIWAYKNGSATQLA